jgi:hypothetical protein
VVEEQREGCAMSFVVLGLWALTGLSIGAVLGSSNVWIEVGLSVIALVLGTVALACAARALFIGQWHVNGAGLLGAFLIFLGGEAFLLNYKASLSSPVSLVLFGLGVILGLAGIGVSYVNLRVIRAHPEYFEAVRLPQPSEGFIGTSKPLDLGWRVKGVIQTLFTTSPLGSLLMPFALWPWMNWITPLMGIDAHPLLVSIVATVLLYSPLGFAASIDPRQSYLERGLKRIQQVRKKMEEIVTSEKSSERPNEMLRQEMDALCEAAAADFWVALKPRVLDSVNYRSRLRPKALSGLSEILCTMMRFRDARTYAQEAVRANPSDAGGHFWLGVSLEGLERKSEALEEFRTSLRLEKNERDRESARSWIQKLESEIEDQLSHGEA